jgi:hypothetical protein
LIALNGNGRACVEDSVNIYDSLPATLTGGDCREIGGVKSM